MLCAVNDSDNPLTYFWWQDQTVRMNVGESSNDFLIAVIIASSPPLNEEELRELDPELRLAILSDKTLPGNHSTRTSYHYKYVTSNGNIYNSPPTNFKTISVAATTHVSTTTLHKAADIIGHMVRHMPSDVFDGLTRSHGVGIFSKSEGITAYPEFAHNADRPECHGTCAGACSNTCTFDGRKYNTVNGVTNRRAVTLDCNVACCSSDPYGHKENILVHEFGHLVMAYMPSHYRDRESLSN